MNYFDILNDDLVVKIFDNVANDIETDILKIKIQLLEIACKYYKDLTICKLDDEDTDTDTDEYICNNYSINYDNINYSNDSYLLDKIGIDEVCIFEFVSIDFLFISPIIKDGTWLDALICTNKLYIQILEFLMYFESKGDVIGYGSGFHSDHHFLEGYSNYTKRELYKKKKENNLNIVFGKIHKNPNIIYLEQALGS